MNKTTEVYELMVRFKDGEIQGAHRRKLETIKDDDGSTLSAKELAPESVALTATQVKQIKAIANKGA